MAQKSADKAPVIDDRERIRPLEIDAWAHEARLAGASDDEIAALREALKGQVRDGAKVHKIREQIAGLRATHLKSYYVQGPGFLHLCGEKYAPGDKVELTPLEAEELGPVVGNVEPEPEPPAPAERKAGRYRFDGPGSLLHEGQLQHPGYVLTLTEEEARALVSVRLTPVSAESASPAA